MNAQEVPDIITKTTRNFNNQFEVPVLFYVVCSLYIFWGVNSYFALIIAWLFVALRIVHSRIHLTYNHVLHRMLTFWFSLLCVMGNIGSDKNFHPTFYSVPRRHRRQSPILFFWFGGQDSWVF
jgi:hypothetical protein